MSFRTTNKVLKSKKVLNLTNSLINLLIKIFIRYYRINN